MSKRLIFLLVGLCILFSLPAFAVDGVTLINQATVAATGGFPYKITQPGSYKLSGNLSVTSGSIDGIDINVDNVVLDLNGFSITSVDTTCTGTPVSSCSSAGASGIQTGHQNVTIRNGSVTGFGYGFNLNGGAGYLLEEVHASGNFYGMWLSHGIVRRSTFSNNLNGLIAQNAVVQDNSVNGNSLGIDVFLSELNGNVSTNNSYGLLTHYSNYGSNLFFQNTIQDVYLADSGSTSQNNNNCSGTVC
jgi:hypothetical protein